jgi:predicted transcriptional regulator
MHKLKDAMTQDPIVVTADSTILEVAVIMRDYDVGMMPVVKNDNLIGVITDRDIVIRAVSEDMDMQTKIIDVMSDEIFCGYEDDTFQRAAELMIKNHVRRLPVVNRDNRLVGMVSLSDMAEARSEIGPAAAALAGIRKS